jgi:RND family efflux transporter MFP subunit
MLTPRTLKNLARRGPRFALALVFIAGCHKSPEASNGARLEPVPSVKVAVAQMQEAPQTIKVQGSLLGDEHAVVGVKVAGRTNKVDVDIGARVRRGDRLAVLDLEDFKVKVQQAAAEVASVRARLGLKPGAKAEDLDRTKAPPVLQEKALVDGAKAEYTRGLDLEVNKAIAAEEVQSRKTNLNVSEARYLSALHKVDEVIATLEVQNHLLTLAEHALADATITAPFDGIIAARHVAPGVYLQVGDPVVTLVRTDPLRFHAGVPEHHALRVEPGQDVIISIEGKTSPLIGKVSRLSPVLNLGSRSLPIEVDVPNPDLALRAGLFAEAEIVVNPRARVVTVGRAAVIEFAGVEKVCVVQDGKATLRRVVTGRTLGERVEIIEGLRGNETIALDGKSVRPGSVIAELVGASAAPESDNPARPVSSMP